MSLSVQYRYYFAVFLLLGVTLLFNVGTSTYLDLSNPSQNTVNTPIARKERFGLKKYVNVIYIPRQLILNKKGIDNKTIKFKYIYDCPKLKLVFILFQKSICKFYKLQEK